MKRFLHIALLYMLALALPVQGWAAAVQTACAPSMHAPAVQMEHTASMQGDLHHHDHAAHHHAESASPMQDHAASDTDNHYAGKHGKVTCSACAACYVGMALLPAMPDLSAPAHGSSPVVAAPLSLFLGHIADGIKRPPRHILG
ncbi:hypothetical protein GCM10007205_08640 [Oxalicibacterium flavum]|uniref:DUF2946 domain-containing protein n=1 Tax=Oxalicibacterium flavum TaxID=179467 RepID=A0A8J2XUT8_9BURK|nr:hypothetical protein [Oxalicibacterium flavum]GGC01669.1 hypothetical protein GCM10007205_08640 [Oxalicibacterium flavum]